MPRRTAWPGLALLDRRFAADFAGDRIEDLFPGAGRDLIRRGILASAGLSSTIPHCICELRRPECVVHVDAEGGVYRGYCNEYALPLEVSIAQIQRYRFVWKAWADWLRHRNALDGASPVLGTGALYAGGGKVSGREYGLVIVAPGCRRAADVVLPEGARQPGRAIVALLLGEAADGLPVDATITADALASDFGTLDGAALERALDAVPLVVTRGEARCVLYSRQSPKGRPIDEAEYERLHRHEVLKEFDIFIDLLRGRVWRRGRPCGTVLDAQGRSKRKKLGDRAINLLADYVRRPGVPMVASETPTYRDSATDARSAAVLLAEVRRSVHGKTFILSGARSQRPGETAYVFEPGDMTWCVLERLPDG
jgi:hypothetical protein